MKRCPRGLGPPPVRLSPRLFGEPTSRTRSWRILYDKKKMMWNCMFSFQEIAEILLLPFGSPLKMSPSAFLSASDKEVTECARTLETLSPSERAHLATFRQKCPEKQFFEIASNPEHRCRTETGEGALMTLTTNTRIWHLSKWSQDCLFVPRIMLNPYYPTFSYVT